MTKIFYGDDHLSSDSGFWLAYLLHMIEGILYTCLFFGLIGTLGFMYALHREIKEDEREYRDRFLDDM
jgi:hypothetical protein